MKYTVNYGILIFKISELCIFICLKNIYYHEDET